MDNTTQPEETRTDLPAQETAETPQPMADTRSDMPVETETAAQPEETDQSTPPPSDLEAMLAEAEHRGYLRGRNEQITLAMQAPALWHEGPAMQPDSDAEPQPAILANMRPSIWDN